MGNQPASKSNFVISREFQAPKKTVFNAFADAKALAEWWGPPGVPITVVTFDFRPNGMFHYGAEMMGQPVWGRFIYKQIKSPDLLEYISSFADDKGNILRAPFNDQFPLEILNRLEFSERNNKTTITLTGAPINASEEEMQFFLSMTESMQKGFGGTLDQLERYLVKRSG